MPIRLAFSTATCPEWPLDRVVAKAREWGFEGVELCTFWPSAPRTECDPARLEMGEVRRIFREAGVTPVCLGTTVTVHDRDAATAQRASERVRQYLKTASELGCGFMRLGAHEIEPGADRRQVIERMASRVRTLGEAAAEYGVPILFQNTPTIPLSRDWWTLVDLVNHPMVGLCWNVATSAAAGEKPAVSVPVLNSRIRLVKLRDMVMRTGAPTPLGDGDVEARQFVRRLMGIGYGGFLSVEWNRLRQPHLAPPEEYLPEARERLRKWMEEFAATKVSAKPAAKAGGAGAAGKGAAAGKPAAKAASGAGGAKAGAAPGSAAAPETAPGAAPAAGA